ncbi:hypothetical protein QTP70_005140 [Hemibagrus guttatus]|uniref:Craniofacial development protein 2-like n=1 Tax=Hemibagrus guttatus TaxID=175788 RepID=A0AAE0RAF8_9TELE|nr:hypothetical protein QTP70_005140 [Hemibagrus guttatus]
MSWRKHGGFESQICKVSNQCGFNMDEIIICHTYNISEKPLPCFFLVCGTVEGLEDTEKRESGEGMNAYSCYKVGCELEEKERFWSELDEVMESIPTGERVVIGADFNGHVGEGNTGDEEVMGKFGVKERNLEGQMVVDFAKRMDMAVVNTYFQKRE